MLVNFKKTLFWSALKFRFLVQFVLDYIFHKNKYFKILSGFLFVNIAILIWFFMLSLPLKGVAFRFTLVRLSQNFVYFIALKVYEVDFKDITVMLVSMYICASGVLLVDTYILCIQGIACGFIPYCPWLCQILPFSTCVMGSSVFWVEFWNYRNSMSSCALRVFTYGLFQ